jgi:Ion transport protein.
MEHFRFKDKLHSFINAETKGGQVYSYVMLFAIAVSILPLFYKTPPRVLDYTDIITVALFIFDYILRWITSDIGKEKKPLICYLTYPLTPFAIIDLLSILPVFAVLNKGFKLLRILRVFRIFRVLKFLRYSKTFSVIITVIKNERGKLLVTVLFAIGYVVVSAMIMFSLEPNSFNSFFDAMYWATTALTTVGYGDIYPVTVVGRIVSMVSSLVGIAIVALPTGIITAGFAAELDKNKK